MKTLFFKVQDGRCVVLADNYDIFRKNGWCHVDWIEFVPGKNSHYGEWVSRGRKFVNPFRKVRVLKGLFKGIELPFTPPKPPPPPPNIDTSFNWDAPVCKHCFPGPPWNFEEGMETGRAVLKLRDAPKPPAETSSGEERAIPPFICPSPNDDTF